MKRLGSLLLAVVFLVGLTACGQNNNEEGPGNSEIRAITPDELLQEMLDEGYGKQNYKDTDARQLGIDNATSCTYMNFYKNADGVEKFPEIWFVKFSNENDAITTFNNFMYVSINEGLPMQSVEKVHGLKALHVDDADTDLGVATIITQVNDTVIFASESWDIDSSGTYDNELNNILTKLGY